MIDFKQIIAEEISKAISVPKEELTSYIEIPKDINNGDYAFPCFRLAKTLRKAPPVIANEIKENLNLRNRNYKSRNCRWILKLFCK